jgi:hypothetical protein
MLRRSPLMPSNQLPEDVRERADEALRSAFVANNTNRVRQNIIDAIAPLIIEWALGEAVNWARSCSGESADAAADYIEDMRAQFTPETTGAADAQ